jgi:hypothetical protein
MVRSPGFGSVTNNRERHFKTRFRYDYPRTSYSILFIRYEIQSAGLIKLLITTRWLVLQKARRQGVE